MVMQSDIGQRMEALAREYASAKNQLESHPAVQRRLRGCRVVLPKGVGVLLGRYRDAAGKLKGLGVDVDVSLVGKLKEVSSVEIVNKNSYLVLEDICCVDSDGIEFERYGELFVAKDIVRDVDGSQVSFTPYAAVVHLEKQKMFLPSVALSCNILAYLYANKEDSEVNKVLMQYKDKGNGRGWHA
ncbi:MAG: hypothetical protein V1914_01010, partial [archaeon]